MSWNKKYDHLKPIKNVRCINTKGCTLLNYGFRGVIKETETNYLIQFNNGSANWYSKDRFIELPTPKPKPTRSNVEPLFKYEEEKR